MSVPAPSKKRASTKQHVRIWFEFYKLALVDPLFETEVESSRSYYEPWGDVLGVSFNKWWLTRSHLFDDLKVREVSRASPTDAVIYLAVPLGMGSKRALEQVKDLLVGRQKEIAEAAEQRSGKSSSVTVARFQLTQGKEFRGKIADADLRLYRDVYLPQSRPAIGQDFARSVLQHFETARTKLSINVLNPVHLSGSSFSDEEMRGLRRCVERAERYVKAAAKGNFPG